MFTTINGQKTYYDLQGTGRLVVLLHGWGGNHDSWFPITKILSNNYQVIVPDLPGFGQSEPPKKDWDINDYVNHLQKLIRQITNDNGSITMIGHSFGGTIATVLANKNSTKLDKLVLVDAKIIRPRTTVKTVVTKLVAKMGKTATSILPNQMQTQLRHKLYDTLGEHDYEETSGTLREIFKNVIAEDYQSYLPDIKTPTLIFWGEKDEDTPLSDGYKIHNLIHNSQFIILNSGTHFAYLENPEEFCEKVISFIEQ